VNSTVHKGDKVTKLTKKVGQAMTTGRVIAFKGESVEVKWEDGHTSLISRVGIVPFKKK
jgi:hypothetical protein